MIFSGVPMIGVVAVASGQDFIERITSQRAGPYVSIGLIIFCFAMSMTLSNLLPRRFVIPIGIIGWVLAVSFLLWYAWFGPGAFGHHTL